MDTQTTWPTGSPRLIVAATDACGQAMFARVEQAPDWSPHLPTWELWGSDSPPRLGESQPSCSDDPAPPVGGIRMFVTDIPPGVTPWGVHATDSVDFVFALSGRVVLAVGDDEVEIRPGDCIVQTGNLHVWDNRTDEPARLAFVMLGVPDQAASQ